MNGDDAAFEIVRAIGRRARAGDCSEWRKLALYVAYNFVLFPCLAGPRWLEVLAGCVATVLVRNGVFVMLQAGSSVGTEISSIHDRDTSPKRRGRWLRFQVETSKNFVLGGVWRILCGGLDRHIEHHLFPNLPPNRLHAVAPEVHRACQQAGIGYRDYPCVWASLRDSAAHLEELSRPP